MKIRKISITFGRTINLGNFESARIDIHMEADREEGDDIEDAYSDLRAEVEDRLAAEVDAITPHGINIPPLPSIPHEQ